MECIYLLIFIKHSFNEEKNSKTAKVIRIYNKTLNNIIK